MKRFTRIKEAIEWVNSIEDASKYERLAVLLKENQALLELLAVLEATNPCAQVYFADEKAFLVTYRLKLNLLTFRKKALKVDAAIIGLPISLSRSGILALDDASGRQLAMKVMQQSQGVTVALNTDYCLDGRCQTLSNFIFINRFSTFAEYLNSMRAAYRRNLLRIIRSGKDLSFRGIEPADFGDGHYALYRSVVERSDYPLEILPPDFFRLYDSEIIEVRDQANQLKAVLVLKGIGDTLNFMFCGFHRDDSSGLYHNLLLFVIRKGIEDGYARIDMGQTSEEAKFRLGCAEETKYLTLHHSNPLINGAMQPLAARFTYRRYKTKHRVFR